MTDSLGNDGQMKEHENKYVNVLVLLAVKTREVEAEAAGDYNTHLEGKGN